MKNQLLTLLKISLQLFAFAVASDFARCQDQNALTMREQIVVMGQTPPIPVSLDGFTGEVADVLKFDLYVQGFSIVTPDAAQYIISGSNAGNVQGRVTAPFSKSTLLARSYTGATLRRQAHAFANDIVLAITGKKGIALTKIAFKAEQADGNGEIYVSDFDGHNAQAVTHDNAIVAAPAWVPGRLALYYTSYKLGNPDIFYHDLSTGQRRVIARFSGLNTSRGRLAGRHQGGDDFEQGRQPERLGLQRGRHGLQAVDNRRRTIPRRAGRRTDNGFVSRPKFNERRVLAKVPAGGGTVQRIPTSGVSNPTEPGLVAGRQMDRVHFADGRLRHIGNDAFDRGSRLSECLILGRERYRVCNAAKIEL